MLPDGGDLDGVDFSVYRVFSCHVTFPSHDKAFSASNTGMLRPRFLSTTGLGMRARDSYKLVLMLDAKDASQQTKSRRC